MFPLPACEETVYILWPMKCYLFCKSFWSSKNWLSISPNPTPLSFATLSWTSWLIVVSLNFYAGWNYSLLSVYICDYSIFWFSPMTICFMEVISSLDELAKCTKLFLTSLISLSLFLILSLSAYTYANVSTMTVRFSCILSSWLVMLVSLSFNELTYCLSY